MKLVYLFKRLFFGRSKVSTETSTVKSSSSRDCVHLRHCTLILYLEYMNRSLEEILSEHFEIEEYAYILHNKNPGVHPHYHVYLSFSGTGVSVLDIVDWFCMPYVYVEPYYGSQPYILDYMIHTRSHQYSVDEIVANLRYLSVSEQ